MAKTCSRAFITSMGGAVKAALSWHMTRCRPSLITLSLLVGCTSGQGTALTSLSVAGQSFDVSSGRWFAADSSALGDLSTVRWQTENPRAKVVLRVEDGAGLLVRDRAPRRLGLSPGDRLEIEVSAGDEVTIYAVSLPPLDLPPLTAWGELGDGLYLLTPRDFSKAPGSSGYARYQLIVDGRGTPVWWRASPGLSFDFRVLANGDFSLKTQLEKGGTFPAVVLSPTGDVRDSWLPELPTDWDTVRGDPHELWIFEDGSSLQTTVGTRTEDLREIGGLAAHNVSATGVEARDANGQITATWSAFDTIQLGLLPPDVQAQINEDAPFLAAHINSIDPVEGGWLLSLRSPGEVVQVDANTGDVLWRLGGPRSDFAFVNDPLNGFFGQHSARWLGDNQVALFDNRTNFDSPAVGDVRGVIYQLDFDKMTAELIFEHSAKGAGGADYAGLIERLPNGETIIGWGSTQVLGDGTKAPILSRIDTSGALVGTLTLPDGMYSYRVWPAWGDATVGEFRPEP